MKNASLVINAILAVAVIVLFILHFSSRPKAETPAAAAETAEGEVPSIVYINTDTLLAKYEYFKTRQEELAKKEEQATSTLQARGQALEREVAEAQRRASTGQMAPKDIQALQENLAFKQQRLLQEQQRASQDLMAEGQKLQDELQKQVKDLLTELRKEQGYDYILSYGPGTGVLMVNDSLDITGLVLERLNKKPEAGN